MVLHPRSAIAAGGGVVLLESQWNVVPPLVVQRGGSCQARELVAMPWEKGVCMRASMKAFRRVSMKALLVPPLHRPFNHTSP